MKRLFGSLRTRLMASHLAVILIGAVALVVTIELLAPSYFAGGVRTMNDMMAQGGMMQPHAFLTPAVEAGLQEAFASSLRRGLVVSVIVSSLAGITIAALATRRILSPLQSIRRATRMMAGGSYEARAEPPAEWELAAVVEDVNALAEALDETEQRRVRLISDVAHELRTPLSTLEGYLEGLLDGVFEPNPAMFAAWDREVRRLKRLTEDLGALSRAEEGSQPLNVEGLDLAGLVTEVVDRLQAQFDASDVSVGVEADAPLTIKGDRDRLSQVLVNVIGNALAYTPADGQVSIGVRSDGSFAVVQVADTGRGLSPEQQTQVFERFYRGEQSGPAGSGIGLTIARAIARRHGGDITAASAGHGTGSTFTVKLPVGR